jgi:hypothetical protein
MITRLNFDIMRQPDNVTCGPTCLHAIYRYHDDPVSLPAVIAEIPQLPSGGTQAVHLACHALRRGYAATIYAYDLKIFDPTWAGMARAEIAGRLRCQLAYKKHLPEFEALTAAYLEFLELGGRLRFGVLTPALIRRYLKKSIPILTGLSATYLYNSAREYDDGKELTCNDVRGESTGHFVVLAGYNKADRSVLIADPLLPNPLASGSYYPVNIYRLICAIILGVLTYDGNLLIISEKKRRR